MGRVAVIGSGISGLSVAWSLARDAHDTQVTLYEAGSYFGGHTHTVDVTLGGHTHGVDTGFLVFNERTYPKLIALFAELGVATAATDMSFSVQVPEQRLEWSGSNLNTVFAQRRNLLRPRFWGMLREVLRFNRLATALAEAGADAALAEPIGTFLDRQHFSAAFRDWYLLPMVACIWSCPTAQMLQFPIGTLIRFCHNHGLIQVTGRPRWFTVVGGAKHYVEAMLPRIADARLNTPVRRIERLAVPAGEPSVLVHTDRGSEAFDEVVLACHSDQALALLAEPTTAEREVLGAIRYHPNRAVLHTDASLLPQRRRAWAAWNYERGSNNNNNNKGNSSESSAVCLHYLINQLQPVPFEQPVVVTLNPVREPRADTVLGSYDYAHPVFDLAGVAAQQRLPALQGQQHTWFCGAWTRYGFHEDGLMSGLAVVSGLRQRWAGAPAAVEAASV
jgi:predicted NAD/FAD-binding protein